jgi:GxxExxY protein
METNDLTGAIIAGALRVHTALGPGLLEGAYSACLRHELVTRGLLVRTGVALPIIYDGVRVDAGYRIDLLVEGRVIVELKAVAKILPLHEAQLLSYLKLSGLPVGLLINFHVRHLRLGIRRMIHS